MGKFIAGNQGFLGGLSACLVLIAWVQIMIWVKGRRWARARAMREAYLKRDECGCGGVGCGLRRPDRIAEAPPGVPTNPPPSPPKTPGPFLGTLDLRILDDR